MHPKRAPLHADLPLARRVERAEVDFCALAGADALAARSVGGPEARLASLEAGGGRALFAGGGSPLNKMLGLGLGGDVSEEELDAIEAFYARRGAPAQIELCPLAAADVSLRLSDRGFLVQAFENQLGLVLDDDERERLAGASRAAEVAVERAAREQDESWVRVVSRGFAAAEQSSTGGAEGAEEPLSFEALEELMRGFTHPELRRYLAAIDGVDAGGTAAWVRDGVLGIFGAATMVEFRRRGVQRAVTLAAILDAPPDVDLVIATTLPGSTSQRTFERLGFRVLYTRAIFVKPVE